MNKQEIANNLVFELLDQNYSKNLPNGTIQKLVELTGASEIYARRMASVARSKYVKAKEHPGLYENCKENGIPIEKVTQYWHKSKHYSVFAKNQPKTYEEIRDDIISEMCSYAPEYPKIEREKKEDPHLLVIDIADLHINKYCEAFLTGFEYNSKLASERALEGTKGVIRKAGGFDIERIVFVIGNDVLNTDNTTKTTTKGTPQDTELHWYNAFMIAKDCYIKCIEYCLQFADVDVIHCPSNHDEMSACFLADTLMSWFRRNENVTFNVSPRYRKYYRYHSNMLELEHGNKGRLNNLPLVMAQEQPKMWSETKFRYSYLHHVHHQDKTQFQSGKDYIGVNVTYLRSPSSPDIWHSEQQYLNLIAVEGFVHSRDNGRVSHITHYF